MMDTSRTSSSNYDRAPLLNVINWILLVITCTSCLLKIISKFMIAKCLHLDDVYMAIAMLATVGYSVAMTFEVFAGLGKNIDPFDVVRVTRFEKAAYSAEICYILSLSVAKIAILQFMSTLGRNKARKNVIYGLIIFNVIWAVAGIIAVAFQCQLPGAWEILSERCFDQRAFWTYIGVTDIIVDLVTAIVPVYLLYDLHMKRHRKVSAMTAFASRALLIPIIALRLLYIHKAQGTNGHFVDDFDTALVTIIHANLNVIVTCFPFIKPVFGTLRTGVLAGDLHSSGSFRYNPHEKRLSNGSTTKTSSTREKRVSTMKDDFQKSRSRAASNASDLRIVVEREVSITSHPRQSDEPVCSKTGGL